jgi:tRNA(adenine34) deaminase
MGIDDSFWMSKAYEFALLAKEMGEVPVGAILIDDDNHCLSSGYNQMIRQNDPTAHAEMLAIRMACQSVHNYRLENTTLYITLEPCAMCAGAIIHSRIKRVVFATRDFKTGAAGSVINLFKPFLLNHKVQVDEGILQTRCAHLIKEFFVAKRLSRHER